MISYNFTIASNYQNRSFLLIREKKALKNHDKLINSYFTLVLYLVDYHKAINNKQ